VTEPYVHSHAAFSLAPEAPFAIAEEASDWVALVLDAPGRPTLTVAVEAVPDATTVDELADAGVGALAPELWAFHLLDRATEPLGSETAIRTLVHHVADARGMALEQWRLVLDGHGWTVSASCPALRYPDLAEHLGQPAAGFSR